MGLPPLADSKRNSFDGKRLDDAVANGTPVAP